MPAKQKEWFTVDREGLAKILRRKGMEFAVFELIQNAWDEAGVNSVCVTLEAANEKGYSKLLVEDDAPEGFKDLAHAYTLFAESEKKGNAEQRGRFNLGEKLVLALCKWATITSTKGMIVFDENGRHDNKTRREFGSAFEALIKMSAEERKHVEEQIHKLIPPDNIVTVFNNEPLSYPMPVAEFKVILPTELSDGDGNLHPTRRETSVTCYPLLNGEPAMIYEMGIPVVEHDCAFHVNVAQKVPLTIDRENVQPRYVRKLHTEVFNNTHQLLSPEETTNEWAQTAIESKDAQPAAVQDFMNKRFGEKRVSYDMSDPEANHKAVAEGYTLVRGGMLSGDAWKNVKEFGAIQAAGKMFPTHPEDFVPHEPAEETDGMKAVREYALKFARETLHIPITVEFGKQKSHELANYGGKRMQFNVANLGERWFDRSRNQLDIDDLITHELGHEIESNHLSKRYNDALTKIAALAMKAVREGRL